MSPIQLRRDRIKRVLSALGNTFNGVAYAEIEYITGIGKGSVFRHINQLREIGAVECTPDQRRSARLTERAMAAQANFAQPNRSCPNDWRHGTRA